MWHVAVGLAHVEAPWLRRRLVGTVCSLRQTFLKRMITFHLIILHSDTDFKGSWSFFTGTAVCVFFARVSYWHVPRKPFQVLGLCLMKARAWLQRAAIQSTCVGVHARTPLLSASKKKSELSLSARSRNLAAHFLTLTERWLRYRRISKNVKLVWKALNVREKRTEGYSIKIMRTCEYVWLKWHVEGDLLNCDEISGQILKAKSH